MPVLSRAFKVTKSRFWKSGLSGIPVSKTGIFCWHVQRENRIILFFKKCPHIYSQHFLSNKERGWKVFELAVQKIRWAVVHMQKKKKKANSAYLHKCQNCWAALRGSEVEMCLYTFGKYSLPWFPHRKQPCEVSDDPRARMRTINRKLLSSKLHPIIIGTENTHKQSQIAARHKVTDNMSGRPPRLCANLQRV